MLTPTCLFLLSVLHSSLSIDLTYYVEEGKSPGTLVGDIAADTHLRETLSHQDRNLIRFSQLQPGATGGQQLFRISKTGKLYTFQTLDTESLCRHNIECFRILKIAVRRAKTFMKIVKIKVVIQDVNDFKPEFPEQEVEIEFSEDDRKGARRSIPNAIDKDVGIVNSQITYKLKKNTNEPFLLSVSKSVDGTSKLSIEFEETLDRESKDSYTVQVIAKDGGSPPKQSILDVHISVTDVNDNAPVFSHNVYNVSIKYEHDIATPVTILSAKDLDSGKNGKVSYHFSARTSEVAKNTFRLNEKTGEVFLYKKFVSGQKPMYKLYVEATDGGQPPLSSIVMVLINVVNEQNNAPIIDVNFFSASVENTATVSEDVDVGSFIAYVMIIDDDFGLNGEVTCYLNHDKFQLQSLGPKEYKITVDNSLNREIQDRHDIKISCQDKGAPPLHAESKFSIYVMDVNDVRPQFSKETSKFWIRENEKPNYHVGIINASDPDLGPGGQLSYSLLTNQKQFLPFQITDNGLISTVISLDHEFQDIYEFRVLVKDNGTPSLNNTMYVTVEVRDENDNAPYFTFPNVNPFLLDIIYYPDYTNNITVLRASDSDSRENAFLKYEIISGNDKQLFTVNHYTGLLSFSRAVTQQDAGSYDLEFVVKDSGTPIQSATTTLSLTLTVSNKTFETLNSVRKKSTDNIHLYLLIAIVVVSVTVSVAITAAMSICILRYNGHRNASHHNEVNAPCKCITEHGKYTCSSQQSNYWPDASVALSTDTEITKTYSGRSRREMNTDEEIRSGQKAIDGVYQEIGDSSDGNTSKHKQVMMLDCEREDSWSGGREIVLNQQGLDPFFTQQFGPSSSLSELNRQKGSPQKTNIQSRDSHVTSHSKALHKPSIGHIPDCSQWVDLKPSSWSHAFSGPYSLSRNPLENNSSKTGYPQLPAKPQVQYLDYLG